MKKILCFLFLGLSLFCFSRSLASEKPKVVIYTSMYEDVIEDMSKVLRKKFPDYDVEFFYGGTGTLQAKIAAEREENKLGCDMLMLADPSYALELKADGLLHPYLANAAKNLALEYDREGYWYPVRMLNMVLAYNPEKYQKEDLSTTFKDFAGNPALQGSIAMPDPMTAGTALVAVSALKKTYGYRYFDLLARNRVMVEPASVALAKLESGECREIMILEESILKKRQQEKSALEVIYPEDGIVPIPSPIMTISDEWSAHGNARICDELTDFFLSSEGQSTIVKGWMHSVLKNPPAIPYDSVDSAKLLSNAIHVNWEDCLSERNELKQSFAKRVKGLKPVR
ncbi:MAG: ABC transporter substrate-binding protein [Desulfovibrio sp.]|nr:ABC transporter substrate-binding protein [Desulfovibrio sp.]